MIKMAVFDALSVNKGLKANGLPEHPVESYRRFVGNGRALLIKRAMGEASADEAKYNSVMEIFNSEYALHCNDNTASYDGCDALLEGLTDSGVLVAVLSNKPDEFIAEILGIIYPRRHFAEAWGQKPEYPTKPDGAALLAMLALHGVHREECVYIGDSDVDVYTARNAGVKMAGVSWGFRGKEELLGAGAPFVADSADELLDHILSL